MRCRIVQDSQPRRWVLVFEQGEDPIPVLKQFADEHLTATCHFNAIGGFSEAVLGYFDPDLDKYKRIPVDEQVEVLSLSGTITDTEDGRRVHAHVVLGASDGRALGGHLLEAKVRPTLEMVVTESPAHLALHEDMVTHLPTR